MSSTPITDSNIIIQLQQSTQSLHGSFEKKGESVFDSLADETMLKIFSYLSALEMGKCAVVCCKWNSFLKDKDLWKPLCSTLDNKKAEFEKFDWKKHCIQSGALFSSFVKIHKPNLSILKENAGGKILCLKFHENQLVTGSDDGSIKIWDFEKEKCIATLIEHTGAVTYLNINESKIISASSRDNRIIIWDLAARTLIKLFQWDAEEHISFFGVNEDIAVMSFSQGNPLVWDLRALKITTIMTKCSGLISASEINKDQIACGSVNGDIYVQNLSSNRNFSLLGHESWISMIQFKGDKIISSSTDKTIRLWDLENKNCLLCIENFEWPRCFQMVEDKIILGHTFCTVCDLNSLELLQCLQTNRTLKTLQIVRNSIVTAIGKEIWVWNFS